MLQHRNLAQSQSQGHIVLIVIAENITSMPVTSLRKTLQLKLSLGLKREIAAVGVAEHMQWRSATSSVHVVSVKSYILQFCMILLMILPGLF